MAKVYGDRWEVQRSLGEGGQAEVFLVVDLRAKDAPPMVLKRIRNPHRRERFLAEVTACKTLLHPNIMRILDHSALDATTDEKMYLVMPHMWGGDLAKRAANVPGVNRLDA